MLVKLITPLGNRVKVKGDKGNVRMEIFFLTRNGYKIIEKDEFIKYKSWLEKYFGGEVV